MASAQSLSPTKANLLESVDRQGVPERDRVVITDADFTGVFLMRNFFLLRRPLPRRTVVFCHVVSQLALLLAGGAWFARHSPWLSSITWGDAWPTLALGMGLLLLSLVGVRLLAELMMLPHHLANLRQGFAPSAVMTRSFERRPAVHDADGAWVNEAKPVSPDEGIIGSARVARTRRAANASATAEPTLNLQSGANDAQADRRRQEPSI